MVLRDHVQGDNLQPRRKLKPRVNKMKIANGKTLRVTGNQEIGTVVHIFLLETG